MAELMIAVVILGIGLLVTSSMFPIAWFKAREVAEGTMLPSIADHAETSVRMLCPVNGSPSTATGQISAFFPGDWFANLDSQPQHLPGFYPDTRVHPLNMRNYLVTGVDGAFSERESDWLDSSRDAPVGDNPWAADDNLIPRLTDSLYVNQAGGFLTPPALNTQRVPLHHARLVAHERLFPPMEARPDPNNATLDEARALWDEQFETRRYCWSVLYRFTQMPGPGWMVVRDDDAVGTRSAMTKSRVLSMYYIALKRPAGARYARQDGISSGSFVHPPSAPRARGMANAVFLPVPWRVEARLLDPPTVGDTPRTPSGIPSDIQVSDPVLATMLQEGTHLFDERTGQVFTITQVRDAGYPTTNYTLSAEYMDKDILGADYSPPTNSADAAQNYGHYWMYPYCEDPITRLDCRGAESEPNLFDTPGGVPDHVETDPGQRFYWVYPPPVESVDGGGVPVFDGSPAVVGVEIRQLILKPEA